MLDAIRKFFSRRMQPQDASAAAPEAANVDEPRRLHIAACALLLELAHADEEFTRGELAHIEAVVRRHLDVDEDAALELIELADRERREAIDLYQFTSLIRENYDLGQKTLLAEIMWGVVLADGNIEKHEGHLLRKIASLLDLEPGYLAQARMRAAGD